MVANFFGINPKISILTLGVLMKKIILILALTLIQTAFAGELPGTDVLIKAHSYIEKWGNLGGNVNSPCQSELRNNVLTIICSGTYKAFGAGEGVVKTKFECVGKFHKLEAKEVYKLIGEIDCSDL
jgi:hypothetical protein